MLQSEEIKAKLRAAKTPESRAKISAAVKKKWSDPAARKLAIDGMRRIASARRRAKCDDQLSLL